MQGSLQPLVGMFTGDDTCLVIPVYQRNYDWKRANCARLYDDLVDTARSGKPNHFFGSIVYKVEGAVGESTIIDGQQRLTTVNLLFAALYHALVSGLVPADDRLAHRIEDGYLVSEYAAGGRKLKLKPVKADAAAYGKVFGAFDEQDETSNVTANYRYFLERITQQEIPAIDLFESIRKLQVMRLQLDATDDAQLIFESLNSTGLDLSKADMIRNWVLMGHTPAEQERLYDQYWNPMENDVDFETSEFLRQFLTGRLGRTPRIDDLYDEFKTWVRSIADTMETTLSELRRFAKHHHALATATTTSAQANRVLRRHNLVDRSVTNPFLMLVLDTVERGEMTHDEFATIIEVVDTYLARRWVVGLPTNSLNKTFALLHREAAKTVAKGTRWSDAIVYQLKRKSGSAAFPTDEEFREALLTRDFYRISPYQRNYFWESLENGRTNDVHDIANRLAEGAISIEHVMPQTLTAAWREDLGPDAEEIHATWINRLGNLTVTGYNSSYSNAIFASKRDREHGFKDTPYWVNKDLRDRDTWDVDGLQKRSQNLAERALKLWPMPSTTYVPPKPPEDVEPMGNETDFTGRTIDSWEYESVTTSADSWKAMLVGVLKHLSHDHLPELHQAATGITDLRLRTVGDVDHWNWRSVGGAVEVWTGQSTYWKIVLLRRVFARLGLDPDELVFHLRPADPTKE